MTEAPKLDLSDASLSAMDDTALLEVMEKLGLDTSTIASREAALAAIALNRKEVIAEIETKSDGQAEPQQPPAADPAPVEAPASIDTTADLEPVVERVERTVMRARDMVASAARAAVGNPGLHASLHNFEVALADFRRAADALATETGLDPDSDVARLVGDIRRFF